MAHSEKEPILSSLMNAPTLCVWSRRHLLLTDLCVQPSVLNDCALKLEFHDADTHTTDILARIVARMSACRSAYHRNNFRKSRVSDVSARIFARMFVSVSVSVMASWKASLSVEWSVDDVAIVEALYAADREAYVFPFTTDCEVFDGVVSHSRRRNF